MGDEADVTSFLESVSSEDWKRLTIRLTRYAFGAIRHRSWHDAEDIAQAAFLQVIDPKLRTWDREQERDFFDHLASLVRKEASRRRMVVRRHRETEYEEDDANDETRKGTRSAPSHEEQLMRDERGRCILAIVRNKAADDRHVLKVLDLLEAHVDTMSEQADHMGCTMMEVRNARVRLGRHVKNAEKELDAEGGASRGQ